MSTKKVSRKIREAIIPEGRRLIRDYEFRNCKELTSIVIPSSVTKIGKCAFYGCSSLKTIVLPNGVTEVGFDAFDSCSSLTSVILPNTVKEKICSFYGCKSLADIRYEGTIAQWESLKNSDSWYFDIKTQVVHCLDGDAELPCFDIEDGVLEKCLISLTKAVIPDGVTKIGDGAFSSRSSLCSVEIPVSVVSIENCAFSQCPSLTDISYGGTLVQWAAVEKEKNWNSGLDIKVIHCIDGDAEIPEEADDSEQEEVDLDSLFTNLIFHLGKMNFLLKKYKRLKDKEKENEKNNKNRKTGKTKHRR